MATRARNRRCRSQVRGRAPLSPVRPPARGRSRKAPTGGLSMKARDERTTRKMAKSNSEQHQGLPVEADEPSQQPDAAAVAGAGTSGGDEQVSIPKPGPF